MRLSFSSDERGAVAVIFAVMVLPILGLVGMGVDYSRASSMRAKLQRSIDSAILTNAARATQPTVKEDITAQVTAAFRPGEVTNLVVNTVVLSGQITTTATATVPRVMPLLGMQTMAIGADAEAKWGSKSFEVAMVIDNSGSMDQYMGVQKKITSVKTAAANFVDFLVANVPPPGTLKIALVPFDQNVNIGAANKTASWVDTSSLSSSSWGSSWGSSSSTWDGCVWDRTQNYDVTNTPPTGGNVTEFQPDPGRASDCPLLPVMKLTTSTNTIKTAIASMAPAGSTNLTIGLAWGFGLLTPNVPFSGPVALGTAGVYKSIIFMTDGQNTKNRWSTSTSTVNARTTLVCSNLRTANIEVYTVGTADADDTVLRACATNPSMYYKVTNGTELDEAFKEIARKISRLRLST
jgi:Flp pilus assembly protein TadG